MFGNVIARSKLLDWALVLIRPFGLLCDRVHGLVDLVVALLEDVVLPFLLPEGPLGVPPQLIVRSGVGDSAWSWSKTRSSS